MIGCQHPQACDDDANRDLDVRLSAGGIAYVSVSTDKDYAANTAMVAVQFV